MEWYQVCLVKSNIQHWLKYKAVLISGRCLQEGGAFPWEPSCLQYQPQYNNRIQTNITSALNVCKIHHKFSVISSLSNACPQPESHLRGVRVNLYGAQSLWILCTVILMEW